MTHAVIIMILTPAGNNYFCIFLKKNRLTQIVTLTIIITQDSHTDYLNEKRQEFTKVMGKKTSKKDKEFLKTYDPGSYDRPSVAVDVLVFTVDLKKGLEVFLIKRNNPPFEGCWALPGGFAGIDESLEKAAARRLKEETGIKKLHMEQLYTFGEPGRDPRTRVISVAYIALAPKDKVGYSPGDAQDASWFGVSLMEGRVVFDSDIHLAFDHESMVKLAIERLRGKINYTDIALNLLDDKQRFTIYELQKIHEAILGKELNAANFRRSFIMNYVNKGVLIKSQQIFQISQKHGRLKKYA